jgi:tetratricopeptide (TPR) repeat protein
MKRAAFTLGMLAVAGLAFAQQPQTQQNKPAGAPAPAASVQTAPAPVLGKRPPQAKTQPEFDAYNAAVANQKDGPAIEKAADDFATKFPDSELRVLLYKAAMRAYQNTNNGEKMSDMAMKLLKIDPDDPEALTGAAEVLAERTRDTDLDKDQRYDQAKKYAQHALETVDTDIAVPAGAPQAQVDAYKNLLRSTAYSVLGTIEYDQGKFADSEGYFRKSIDVYAAQPDPVVVLRLALALDKQAKYPDALKEANRAVELTQEGTTAGTTARHERDRLVQLTGGSAPAPPAAGAPVTPAPNSH